MKHAIRLTLLTGAAVLLAQSAVWAQLANQNLTVQATLAQRASINLSVATLTFPDADPAAQPTLTAPVLTVQARARVAPGTNLALTVLAGGDFTGVGGATIPATDISWTVTGAGYAAGALSTVTPQGLGTFTGPGSHNGTQTYSMPNSWTYAPDTYSMTVTYTLSAP